MSTRRQNELFRDFQRWGFDQKDWAPGTRQVYLWRVKQANAFLEERGKSVFWATLDDLKDFLFTIDQVRSRNNTRQALIGFGDYLKYKGIRDSNPARELPRLKASRVLPKPVTVDEASRLLRASKALGEYRYTLMTTLLFTALRRGDVAKLEWRAVSADWKWLTLEVSKSRRELQIPIHPALQGRLQSWRVQTTDAQWVFPSPKFPGKHLNHSTLYKWVREIANFAGLEGVTPHTARHTAATRMLEQTGSIMTVKEYLGHESLSSTQVYALVRNPVTEKAVYQFDFAEGGAR